MRTTKNPGRRGENARRSRIFFVPSPEIHFCDNEEPTSRPERPGPRTHRLGGPPARDRLLSGGLLPQLRRLRRRVRQRPHHLPARSVGRQFRPGLRAAVRDDVGRAAAARADRNGGFLPQADRPRPPGAGLLVADAARALLPVYALRRCLQPVDRPRAVHRRSDAAQNVDLRLQLLLRHHAALVSLYADRTLSDHAADQPVARAGLAARVAERPRDLGPDAAAALREDAGPGARLHGQLRQHGALRRLRLERVRHVPLRLGPVTSCWPSTS